MSTTADASGPVSSPSFSYASSSSSSSSSRKVPISIKDGRAYVWSASDVLFLRSQHRIIGILTGSLPLLPQQNAYLGLPLQLMPEEVLLLVSRNAAILVDDQECHKPPTKEQWLAYTQQQQEDVQWQREMTWKSNVEQKKAFEEALQKSKKKSKKDNKSQEDKQSSPSVDAEISTAPMPTEEQATAPKPPSDLSNISYTHITHDSSDTYPWYSPPSSDAPPSPHLLAQLQTSSTPTTRQLIFNHLNHSGYYLSCGLRFGGDFVVYPGDPFRYHSHYTLTCPKDSQSSFSVGKLIADGRLGTAVKKVHLIASLQSDHSSSSSGADEGTQTQAQHEQSSPSAPPLSFYSLTWAGFGT